MKRETIFLGFFSLLLALGFDALCSDAHAGIIIWLACIALWGVFTTLTLSERLENVTEFNRRILKQLREKEEKGK
jgi:hypothetical protein